MKTKYFLLVFYILIGNNLLAQYDDDYTGASHNKTAGIMRGDNLITISTNHNAQTNFMEFGKHLVGRGFTFKSKDFDFMQLVTDPRRPENGLHYEYMLKITFIDTNIIIRVNQSGMSMGAKIIWTPWYYATSTGNIMHQSFLDFYPILTAYNYPVIFSKE